MISLTYKLHTSALASNRESLYLSEICGEGGEDVRFYFPGICRGRLTVGDFATEIRACSASVPLDKLKDGIHEPKVTVGTRVIYATPIKSDGNKILHAPLDHMAYGELREMLLRIESTLYEYIEKTRLLDEKIRGKRLLNFNETKGK
jgi:hypothetical protein